MQQQPVPDGLAASAGMLWHPKGSRFAVVDDAWVILGRRKGIVCVQAG